MRWLEDDWSQWKTWRFWQPIYIHVDPEAPGVKNIVINFNGIMPCVVIGFVIGYLVI